MKVGDRIRIGGIVFKITSVAVNDNCRDGSSLAKLVSHVRLSDLTKLEEEKKVETPEIKWRKQKRTLADLEEQEFVFDGDATMMVESPDKDNDIRFTIDGYYFTRKAIKQMIDTLTAIYNQTEGK